MCDDRFSLKGVWLNQEWAELAKHGLFICCHLYSTASNLLQIHNGNSPDYSHIGGLTTISLYISPGEPNENSMGCLHLEPCQGLQKELTVHILQAVFFSIMMLI